MRTRILTDTHMCSGSHQLKQAEDICMVMGQYFQIQDDVLDCYGTVEVCVCVCVYTHTYARVCTQTHTRARIHTHTHELACTCRYMHFHYQHAYSK
jgi:hypothetical protein